MTQYRINKAKNKNLLNNIKTHWIKLMSAIFVISLPMILIDVGFNSTSIFSFVFAWSFWFVALSIMFNPNLSINNKIVLDVDNEKISVRKGKGKPKEIRFSKIRQIKETKHRVMIRSFFRSIIIPKSFDKFDELRNEIVDNVDKKVFSIWRDQLFVFFLATGQFQYSSVSTQ